MSVLETRMKDRCETCAFRPGTRANQTETTLIKAKLCIETGDPFLCHESPREAWCAGVADAMEARFNAGKEIETGWRRDVKMAISDLVIEIEDGNIKSIDEFDAEFKKRLARMRE